MDEYSIMIVGVGGQGTLLASRLIGHTALSDGYDVKLSEVHGMSQRGGSVVTYVKFSKNKVWSPVITKGCADIILAFEQLEAYRSIDYLKKGGLLIGNTQHIKPMPVITGQAAYPENINEKIGKLGINLIMHNALDMALSAGSQKAINVVLIGVLAKHMTVFSKEKWIESINAVVPKKLLDINLKAFEEGYRR